MSTPAPTAPSTPAQPAQASAPAQAAAPSQPTQAEMRKLKLKVDGQEMELPENEVIARAQRESAAAKRFQEAAEVKRQAEELMKFAKENPRKFFEKTGLDIRKFSEEYLIEQLQLEQMTPEQKKAKENEEKLRQYEEAEKARKESERQAEMQAAEAKYAENYNKLFIDALSKSGLPKTPYTVKRMAELQLVNLRNKYELSADQLAKVVREDYIAEQKALFGADEGDKLLELLGPDIIKKISKAQIAKLKAKSKPGDSGGTPPPKKDEKPISSWREYQLRNRRRIV